MRTALVIAALAAVLSLAAPASHAFVILPSPDEMAPSCGDKLSTVQVSGIIAANKWSVPKKIAGDDLAKFLDYVAVKYNLNRADVVDADELWVVESPDVPDAYLLLWFKEGCLVGKIAALKEQFDRDYAEAFPVKPLPKPGQTELIGFEPYCQRHAALRHPKLAPAPAQAAPAESAAPAAPAAPSA